MSARVIGLGQPAAGDDGVGIAVLERLREMGVPEGTELLEAREATALIALLETEKPVVLVDAVVGQDSVGEVLELDGMALGARPHGPRLLSTHGVDVGQAIALARLLSPGAIASSIWIVGVTIERPDRYVHGLSPEVLAAVPHAARAVLTRVGG
jgi:hydrogenase maturation protease